MLPVPKAQKHITRRGKLAVWSQLPLLHARVFILNLLQESKGVKPLRMFVETLICRDARDGTCQEHAPRHVCTVRKVDILLGHDFVLLPAREEGRVSHGLAEERFCQGHVAGRRGEGGCPGGGIIKSGVNLLTEVAKEAGGFGQMNQIQEGVEGYGNGGECGRELGFISGVLICRRIYELGHYNGERRLTMVMKLSIMDSSVAPSGFLSWRICAVQVMASCGGTYPELGCAFRLAMSSRRCLKTG